MAALTLNLGADQCVCRSEGFNPIIQKYFCDCVYECAPPARLPPPARAA